MTDTMLIDYQNKIVNASREDLLIINYELMIMGIDELVEIIHSEDKKLFNKKMVQVNGYLRELIDGLDFKYEISKDLMSLYVYINKQLIEASLHFNADPLIEVKKLLNILLIGWKEARDKVTKSDNVMSNGQKVYAGLTYGKGVLNETILENSISRGFKA